MTSRKTTAALATGLVVALFGTLASGSLPALGEVPGVPAQNAAAKLASASLEETWGVKVLGIRLSAANHILDFRYQVIVVPTGVLRLQAQWIRLSGGIHDGSPITSNST